MPSRIQFETPYLDKLYQVLCGTKRRPVMPGANYPDDISATNPLAPWNQSGEDEEYIYLTDVAALNRIYVAAKTLICDESLRNWATLEDVLREVEGC